MTIQELIAENKRRMVKMYTGFNPLTGEGAPLEREWLIFPILSYPINTFLSICSTTNLYN